MAGMLVADGGGGKASSLSLLAFCLDVVGVCLHAAGSAVVGLRDCDGGGGGSADSGKPLGCLRLVIGLAALRADPLHATTCSLSMSNPS